HLERGNHFVHRYSIEQLKYFLKTKFEESGNGYSENDEKQSQKRQNQARNGKDKVKSKLKSVKVNKKVNPDKFKS
ncbi:hypothetical protein Tco_0902216, partial [Tanacetum coccineum]